MAEINSDGNLIHVDRTGYTLTGARRQPKPGYENISLYARTSANGEQITIDFTEEAFKDWLETMREWVATWD